MMDAATIARITDERFAIWTDLLLAQDATPTVVVGVGHNDHEGQIYVFSPGAVSPEAVAHLLVHAVHALETLRKEHETETHDDIQSHTNGSGNPGD